MNLRSTGKVFIDYPSIDICLMFFSGLNWVCWFGGGRQQRLKCCFIPLCQGCVPSAWLTCWWWPCTGWGSADQVSPPSSYSPPPPPAVSVRKSRAQPTLKAWELCFTFLRAEYRPKLLGILHGTCSPFINIFTHSYRYDGWICDAALFILLLNCSTFAYWELSVGFCVPFVYSYHRV